MPLLVSPLINLNPKIKLILENLACLLHKVLQYIYAVTILLGLLILVIIFFNRFKNENKFKVRKWKRIKIDFFFLSAVLTRVKIN